LTRVAILGPGGVGGFVAGALARAGEDVVVVAREPTVQLIGREGLRVRSRFLDEEFVARPRAVPALEEPVDVLFVTPKATALTAALARVRGRPALVVPLLNGLAHRTVLRERFGDRAVAGTIRVESDRPQPGLIVQTSPFLRVEVAADDPACVAGLEAVVALLERAGVPAAIGASEAQVTWSKLCRLCALALATTAFDRPLGPIRSTPELRGELRACVEEACAVARAEGAAVEPADTMRELEEAHPELSSSMARDVRAGREPELDAIAGEVARAGVRAGVPTPTIERLAALVARRAAPG
jgi:2-dehydropantoate 2-reductase